MPKDFHAGDVVIWDPTVAHLIPAEFRERFPGPFRVALRQDYRLFIRTHSGSQVLQRDAFPNKSQYDLAWHYDWFADPGPFLKAVWKRRHHE